MVSFIQIAVFGLVWLFVHYSFKIVSEGHFEDGFKTTKKWKILGLLGFWLISAFISIALFSTIFILGLKQIFLENGLFSYFTLLLPISFLLLIYFAGYLFLSYKFHKRSDIELVVEYIMIQQTKGDVFNFAISHSNDNRSKEVLDMTDKALQKYIEKSKIY